MRRIIVPIALVSLMTVAVGWWRRNRRVGTRFVNEVVNPLLVSRGFPGRTQGEIATLEHVGRRSGIRRHTLVHPVPTADGVRILVPLGEESEWAQNVLAAGHCRMQVGEVVQALDEPVLVPVGTGDSVPAPIRWLQERLGFRWLLLHRFAEAPGSLDEPEAVPAQPVPAAVVEEPVPVPTA